MSVLKRDDILKADDIKYQDVECPEWNGTVRIKVMSGTERDSYESSVYEVKDGGVKFKRDDVRSKLLSKCIVDDDGKRIFTDSDIKELGKKSSLVLDRLFDVAQIINGLSKESVDQARKNSQSEGQDTSTSPSLEN